MKRWNMNFKFGLLLAELEDINDVCRCGCNQSGYLHIPTPMNAASIPTLDSGEKQDEQGKRKAFGRRDPQQKLTDLALFQTEHFPQVLARDPNGPAPPPSVRALAEKAWMEENMQLNTGKKNAPNDNDQVNSFDYGLDWTPQDQGTVPNGATMLQTPPGGVGYTGVPMTAPVPGVPFTDTMTNEEGPTPGVPTAAAMPKATQDDEDSSVATVVATMPTRTSENEVDSSDAGSNTSEVLESDVSDDDDHIGMQDIVSVSSASGTNSTGSVEEAILSKEKVRHNMIRSKTNTSNPHLTAVTKSLTHHKKKRKKANKKQGSKQTKDEVSAHETMSHCTHTFISNCIAMVPTGNTT